MKSFPSVMLIVTVIFQLITTEVATAQALKKNIFIDSLNNKSEWRIGVRYTSDYYFMGRADSVAAPYLSPSVGYYHKSGLFARGSLSYLTGEGEGRIDLYILSTGYEYYRKRTALGVSVSEYFFHDLSYNVQAEMSTHLYTYAGYDFSALMIYLDAGIGFSENTDIFIGGEINRTFYLMYNKLRFTPAIYINAGTQYYYDEYYTNRSQQTGSGKGKGKGGNGQQAPIQDIRILESEKFKLLDYEAELQLTYKVRKVRFYITGTWVFPLSPSTVITDQGTYEEALENGFYWTTGVRLTL